MAQSSVAITAGTGTAIDVFQTSVTGNNRQSIVIADPSTDAAATKVTNADPGSSDYGPVVRERYAPTISTNLATVAGAISSTKMQDNIAQVGGNAIASAGQNGVISVGGQQATNNNISTNGYPILIGGSDYGGTAKIQSLKVDSSGNAQANITQVGGSSLALGQTTMSASIPVAIASNQSAVSVTQKPATSGGLTPYKKISAASTNATSVKGSAGNLHHANAQNNTATIYYLKLYDKASAPTVGTDTPVHTYLIPANAQGSGVVIPLPDIGVSFANGIAFAITGAIADSDTTACVLNGVAVNLDYN